MHTMKAYGSSCRTFDSLSPLEEGLSDNFDVANPLQGDQFGYVFEGFIEIPTNGTYTFSTSSDDGSKLYIGLAEVVDNDGLHAMVEVSGAVGLKAGLHPIKVVYFERDQGQGLEVRWEGPGNRQDVDSGSCIVSRYYAAVSPGGRNGVAGRWQGLARLEPQQRAGSGGLPRLPFGDVRHGVSAFEWPASC